MKKKEIRFVFFGTSELSVFALDALEKNGLLPALIVTSPDKPRGRGLATSPSPVKTWARERGIDAIEPPHFKGDLPPEFTNTDWDIFIVAAYPKLLPASVLNIPRRRSLNIHPSLLPKFRGPSPILSAILADERQTGVSIMLMEEKMDAGPVLAQARIEIDESEWPLSGSVLSEMLFVEGGNLLAETCGPWLAGEITPEVQDEATATYTKKFTTEDAHIDFTGDPRAQLLKVKAFDTGLRAWGTFVRAGKNIRAVIADAEIRDGTFSPIAVIPEGKKLMSYEDFLRSGVTPAGG